MNWRDTCREQIKQDEQSGKYARWVYRCPAGALTIGWGHNVDKDKGGPGISATVAELQLNEDIDECADDLVTLFASRWEDADFTDARKAALINVRFQLGPNRFRGFTGMIAAIKAGDWKAAAAELLDSALFGQAKERTYRRANDLERG